MVHAKQILTRRPCLVCVPRNITNSVERSGKPLPNLVRTLRVEEFSFEDLLFRHRRPRHAIHDACYDRDAMIEVPLFVQNGF